MEYSGLDNDAAQNGESKWQVAKKWPVISSAIYLTRARKRQKKISDEPDQTGIRRCVAVALFGRSLLGFCNLLRAGEVMCPAAENKPAPNITRAIGLREAIGNNASGPW